MLALTPGAFWAATSFAVVCVLLVLACLLLLRVVKTDSPSREFRPESVKPVDKEVLTPLVIYLLPYLTQQSMLSIFGPSLFTWGLLLFVICVFPAVSYNFTFNPLLTILGYRFYQATETNGMPHILITNRPLDQSGKTLDVTLLSECLLVEKKRSLPANPATE